MKAPQISEEFKMNQIEYTKDSFKLRLEARVKNAQLVGAREMLGLSQQQAAGEIGIRPARLSYIESMRDYPNKDLQTKICGFYRDNGVFLFEEDVFPEELKSIKKTKYVGERTILKQDIISLSYEDTKLLSAAYNKTAQNTNRIEMKDEINFILSKLSYREKEVLELRFGLNGKKPHTLVECSKLFNVTRERIRQIEAVALKRLRHPKTPDEQKERLDIKN